MIYLISFTDRKETARENHLSAHDARMTLVFNFSNPILQDWTSYIGHSRDHHAVNPSITYEKIKKVKNKSYENKIDTNVTDSISIKGLEQANENSDINKL